MYTSNADYGQKHQAVVGGIMYGQNKYTSYVIRQTENLQIGERIYILIDAIVGSNYTNVDFKLYDLSDNFIKNLSYTNYGTQNGTTLYDVFIQDFDNITNGNYYKIKYFDGNTNIYDTGQFIISWTRDTTNDSPTYNESGEQTGYIDLTTTNNKIDNVANQITIQGQNITNAINKLESGEKKRQTFWENAYNTLFVMNSGDVQQLKNRISGELMEVIDGKNDYTEEYELLDTLNNTRPTDFIISWQAVKYENQNFIPSGEINFNSIVNEWELTEVHRVLRIIVVGALAFLGAKALWKCITITLGIGMEMYDDYEDENKTIEIQQNTYDTNTGIITHSISRRKGNVTNTIKGRYRK